MQGSLATGLLHEAASVYRLVEFIDRFCTEQKSSRSYVPATKQFFDIVTNLAEHTKLHLVSTAAEAKDWEGSPRAEHWFANERTALHTIKGSWHIIHRYLKPAADAHALQVPVPLVKLAEHQLESVRGMQGARIAVLLTPELNYFQTSHTRLKTAISTLEDATTTPTDSCRSGPIGFVELPFSQGPGFFTNIALYHELGHFTLEQCSASSRLVDAAEQALKDVCGTNFTGLNDAEKAGVRGWLRKWAEEIFCDLFAVRLIGPAFSFASMEMFSLIGLLAEDNKTKFLPSHPAPACRFHEQLKLLKDDQWWGTIEELDPDHRTQIEHLAALTDYVIYVDRQNRAGDQLPLDAFRRLLPEVQKLAKELTAEPTAARECFAAERADIEECFFEGIVPSRLFNARTISSAYPIAIVNAAFYFYLTRLPNLIDSLAEQKSSNLENRSHWIKRLEMWTVKAIEDYFLLDGVQKYGSSTTRGTAFEALKES